MVASSATLHSAGEAHADKILPAPAPAGHEGMLLVSDDVPSDTSSSEEEEEELVLPGSLEASEPLATLYAGRAERLNARLHKLSREKANLRDVVRKCDLKRAEFNGQCQTHIEDLDRLHQMLRTRAEALETEQVELRTRVTQQAAEGAQLDRRITEAKSQQEETDRRITEAKSQ